MSGPDCSQFMWRGQLTAGLLAGYLALSVVFVGACSRQDPQVPQSPTQERQEKPAQASAEDVSLPGLSSTLDELRKGGLVIYFRHATTDLVDVPDEGADLADCKTQRNLSREGRSEATLIGQAFQALDIPVGEVISSPFCRCKDTASLAFGRYRVDNNLYFSIRTDNETTKRYAEALRTMLATPPASGANTIIVAHTANLREATGIWPKPEGVAFIFRPDKRGGFKAVAKVMPNEWPAHARLEAQPTD